MNLMLNMYTHPPPSPHLKTILKDRPPFRETRILVFAWNLKSVGVSLREKRIWCTAGNVKELENNTSKPGANIINVSHKSTQKNVRDPKKIRKGENGLQNKEKKRSINRPFLSAARLCNAKLFYFADTWKNIVSCNLNTYCEYFKAWTEKLPILNTCITRVIHVLHFHRIPHEKFVYLWMSRSLILERVRVLKMGFPSEKLIDHTVRSHTNLWVGNELYRIKA